jgi:hypothetical protein
MLMSVVSCMPPKYLITAPKSVPSDVDGRAKKFIFLPKGIETPNKFAYLINKNRTAAFTEELKKVSDADTRRFLRSIQNLFAGKYSLAYNDIVNVPRSSFDYEAQILLADVLHEMHVDTLNYQRIYQRVADSTKDENIRAIAIKRNRFLKYEK